MFTNNWLLTFVVFNSCWSRSNCPSWTWSKRIQHSKSWTRSICQVCYSKTWLFWTICGQKNSCRRSKKLQGLAVCMGGEMDIKIFVFVMYYVRTGLKYIFQCGHSRAVNLTRLQIWRTWLSRQIAVPRRCIKAKFTGSVRGGGGGGRRQHTLTTKNNTAKHFRFPCKRVEHTTNGKLHHLSGRLQTQIWRPEDTPQNLEITDINLETGRYGSKCGDSRIIRESWQSCHLVSVSPITFFNLWMKT